MADQLALALRASIDLVLVLVGASETPRAWGDLPVLILSSEAAAQDQRFRGLVEKLRSFPAGRAVARLDLSAAPGTWDQLLDPAWAHLPAGSGAEEVRRWFERAIGDDDVEHRDSIATASPFDVLRERAPSGTVARRTMGQGRYLLLDEIGRGGMGIVYSGWDREHDRPVAIKTMRRVGIAVRARFKQEFQSAADLHHPHIAQLYDLVEDGGVLYIVMELIEGLSFDRYIDAHPEELRDRLAELTEGLAAVHGAGYLHHDIKPANVLVDGAGRTVLLDFGLAQMASAGTGAVMVAGTPPFVAPERQSRQSSTPASDWYGVGMILYRCLTGHLLAAVRGPVTNIPVRPVLAGDTSDLESLCRRLLDPDPGRRPAASEILRLLRRERVPEPTPAVPSFDFVGRRDDLAALRAAFRALRNGVAQCVWVTGPSGIGKSALLQKFLDELEGQVIGPPIVVRARCHEREAIPFKAFDRLADALIGWAAEHVADMPALLADVSLSALGALFATARTLPHDDGAEPEVASVSLTEQRSRSFEAFRRLAIAVTQRAPLVLAVDDVDQADRDSAALFVDLFRSPPPRILFIGAARSIRVADSVFHDELARRTGGHTSLPTHELPLRGLSLTDLAPLFSSGRDTKMAQDLLTESEGNPGVFEALYGEWSARGDSAQDAGLVTCDDVLGARFDRLPADLRDILKLVAVAEKPIAQEIVLRAVGGEVDPLASVHALAAKRLLRIEGTRRRDTVRCHDERLRRAVVARMVPDELRGCHLRLANELERAVSDDWEALAHHFHGANDLSRATTFALRAAERAESALAFDQAATFYGRALVWLGADSDRRYDLLLRTARCEASSGRSAAAARDYLAAIEAGSRAEEPALRRLAAEQLLLSGQVDAGLRELGPLLLEAGVPFTGSLLRLRIAALAGYLWLHGLEFSERPESAVSPALLERADLCATAARGLVAVDFERGAWFAAKALQYALQTGERLRISRALSLAAGILGPLRSDWGITLLNTADEVAGPKAQALLGGTLSVTRGHLEIFAGDWKAALHHCELGDSALRTLTVTPTWERNIGRMGMLRALEELGRFAQVHMRSQEWLNDALDRGDVYAEVTFALYRGMAELMAGDSRGARVLHDRVLSRWQQRGFTVQHLYATRLAAACDLFDGSPAAAWHAVEAAWPRIEQARLLSLPITRLDALLMRGRVAISLAENGAKDALAVANHCLRLLERDTRSDAAAGSRVLRAALAWGAGDARRSINLLEEARGLYELSGMEAMGLFVAFRRAMLLGSAAEESIAPLVASLHSCGIGDVARMADVVTPGFRVSGWNAR